MCEHCEWESLIEQIDEAIEGENCGFALETLEGIREWCAEHEHCTEGQQNAVQNIIDAAERREECF